MMYLHVFSITRLSQARAVLGAPDGEQTSAHPEAKTIKLQTEATYRSPLLLNPIDCGQAQWIVPTTTTLSPRHQVP